MLRGRIDWSDRCRFSSLSLSLRIMIETLFPSLFWHTPGQRYARIRFEPGLNRAPDTPSPPSRVGEYFFCRCLSRVWRVNSVYHCSNVRFSTLGEKILFLLSFLSFSSPPPPSFLRGVGYWIFFEGDWTLVFASHRVFPRATVNATFLSRLRRQPDFNRDTWLVRWRNIGYIFWWGGMMDLGIENSRFLRRPLLVCVAKRFKERVLH